MSNETTAARPATVTVTMWTDRRHDLRAEIVRWNAFHPFALVRLLDPLPGHSDRLWWVHATKVDGAEGRTGTKDARSGREVGR